VNERYVDRLKIIGITGSVGSGKTEVCRVFEQEFGACVLITDKIGHLFMQPGTQGYREIVKVFGNDILETAQGMEKEPPIERKKLGDIVFSNHSDVEKLNAIIHPFVNSYVADRIAKEQKRGIFKLFVIESALLIESGYEQICDELWYVTADDSIRRQRLKDSRGYSDKKIDEILKKQLPDEIFRQHCHHVLLNNGSVEEIAGKIKFLLEL